MNTKKALCNLNDSAEIFVQLIETNTLATITGDSTPEALNLVIKNFSPAQLALGAEAKDWHQPVILFFVQTDDPAYSTLHSTIESMAEAHADRIKCIEVDADELFTIVDHFGIEAVPALVLMHEGAQIANVENIPVKNFTSELQKMIEAARSQIK